MYRKYIHLLIILCCHVPGLFAATNGTLDVTFNSSGPVPGFLVTPIGTFADGLGVAVQDDTIIVVGVTTVAGLDQVVVVRYLDDGSLDPSFGVGGIVLTPIGTASNAQDVVIQGNKILVCGSAAIGGRAYIIVIRYLNDGSLDATFGVGGIAIAAVGTTSNGNAFRLALQGDKIVTVGTTNFMSTRWVIARFNDDGSLDTTFNPLGAGGTSPGIITLLIGSTSDSPRVAIDGTKIVVGGRILKVSFRAGVARFNNDGTLDTTFNPLGLGGDIPGTVTTVVGPNDPINSINIQDNKIVAGGFSLSSIYRFYVIRYNDDASLDITFNPSGPQPGTVTTLIGPSSYARDGILQGSQIILGGAKTSPGRVYALARYNHNGSLDTAFNPNGFGGVFPGTVVTDGQGNPECAALALQGQKLVAAGKTSVDGQQQIAVARYWAFSQDACGV